MTDKISYTYIEAAEATGAKLTAIKDAVRDNHLVAHYLSPRRPVIFADELARWIKSKPTDRPT